MSVSTGYTRATLPAQIFPKTNRDVLRRSSELNHQMQTWPCSIFFGSLAGVLFGASGVFFAVSSSHNVFLIGFFSTFFGSPLVGTAVGGIIALHQFKKIAPLKANVDVDNNDLNHMEIANLLNYEESALSIDDFIKAYCLNKT